jgi:hypothetical protein
VVGDLELGLVAGVHGMHGPCEVVRCMLARILRGILGSGAPLSPKSSELLASLQQRAFLPRVELERDTHEARGSGRADTETVGGKGGSSAEPHATTADWAASRCPPPHGPWTPPRPPCSRGLNHVHSRWSCGDVPDLAEFVTDDWAAALWHDRFLESRARQRRTCQKYLNGFMVFTFRSSS